jgi:hypothetical protein
MTKSQQKGKKAVQVIVGKNPPAVPKRRAPADGGWLARVIAVVFCNVMIYYLKNANYHRLSRYLAGIILFNY